MKSIRLKYNKRASTSGILYIIGTLILFVFLGVTLLAAFSGTNDLNNFIHNAIRTQGALVLDGLQPWGGLSATSTFKLNNYIREDVIDVSVDGYTFIVRLNASNEFARQSMLLHKTTIFPDKIEKLDKDLYIAHTYGKIDWKDETIGNVKYAQECSALPRDKRYIIFPQHEDLLTLANGIQATLTSALATPHQQVTSGTQLNPDLVAGSHVIVVLDKSPSENIRIFSNTDKAYVAGCNIYNSIGGNINAPSMTHFNHFEGMYTSLLFDALKDFDIVYIQMPSTHADYTQSLIKGLRGEVVVST